MKILKNLQFIFVVLLLVSTYTMYSQSDLGIGEWKAHLPFRKSFHVTQSEETIFFAAEWGLLSLDKSEKSPSFLTKVDGLSDVGLSIVKFNKDNKTLLVTYQNSNIDLVRENEIVNINEIFRNNQIIGDKTIHDVTFDNNKAYLSCAFGLVQFDTDRDEFGFTTFSPFQVFSALVWEDNLYMATDGGLYKITLDGVKAFEDFNNWTLVTDAFNLPEDYSSTALTIYNNDLYGVINQELFNLSKGQSVYKEADFIFNYISRGEDQLMVGLKCITGCSNKVILINESNQVSTVSAGCVFGPNYAIQNGDDIWYADDGDGFRTSNLQGQNCDQLFFNSPFSHNVSEIKIYDSKVYVASGGVNGSFSYQFRRDGLFIYDDLVWDHVNVFNNQIFQEKQLWDIFTLAVNPINDKLYVGSYFEGLVEMEGREVINVFDQDNSSLGGTVGDMPRERISGLEFDDEGNLWIANFLAARPLSVYTTSGEWKNFNYSPTTLTQIAIDRNGYKWVVVQGNSAGLFVLDSGTDPIDESDDQAIYLNSNNSGLTTNNVNCITADLDGTIWVGTSEGPFIFQCGEEVFSGECAGFQKTILIDGEAALLLDKEDIRTIEVDGANRKWFGTRNGIFVQSPTGESLIEKFDESNSPLIDNSIIDIAIDNDNGEVFIGTNKGIVEYRTNATFGPSRHTKKVYAFPNPVRPEYSGPIAIRGLARDADVVITDITGQMVYKTKANGGLATWFGKDLNGVRAASGVYLVYSTSTQSFDEPDAFVTKILFLRP